MRKEPSNEIKDVKARAKYQDKKTEHFMIKGGMGTNTKIATKHVHGFNTRFLIENAKVLAEAQEENERIRKKRFGQKLGRLRGLGIIK